MKYRPGDVLLVRATVVSSENLPAGYLLARFGVRDKRDLCLNVENLDVASVEHTRIEVGDAIQCAREQGVVLAADGKDLWVLRSDGFRVTWRASDCERVD